MRVRLLSVCASRARTVTAWLRMGRPRVSSATTLKRIGPCSLTHDFDRMPSTTALGHRSMRLLTVCVSPLGSA